MLWLNAHVLNSVISRLGQAGSVNGILISMHGFNSLKCSVNPYFLLKDHFIYQLSAFLRKVSKGREYLCCGSLINFNFSAHALSNCAIILAAGCWQWPIFKVELN